MCSKTVFSMIWPPVRARAAGTRLSPNPASSDPTPGHARRSGELVLLTARGKQGSDALTARECSIAEMYVAGHSHKQVAEQLHLSPATVKAHLRRIYSKLSINNKTQLLRMTSYD
jgi:DNA-binding NarL/FixJ family response regulator